MTGVQNYECLALEEALELSNVTISQVSDNINVPPTSARLILETYSWNVDELNANIEEYGKKVVLADCGIPFKKSRFSPHNSAFLPSTSPTSLCIDNPDFFETEQMEKCQGCAKTAMEVELVRLDCAHLFCVSCWRSHIETKLKDGTATLLSFFPIRCPASKCGFILDESQMEFIIDPILMYSFRMRLLERYILTNRLMRLCPNRTCVVLTFEKRRDKVDQCSSVTCKCGITFCFACANKINLNCSVRVVSLGDKTREEHPDPPQMSTSAPSASSIPIIPKMKTLKLKEDYHSNPMPRRNLIAMEKDDEKTELERKALLPFYELIDQQSEKVCYGIEDVIYAIEAGAAKVVFLWKKFPAKISVNSNNDRPCLDIHEDAQDFSEDVKQVWLTEWTKRNCAYYGTEVEWIEGRSKEGLKFCNGFGVGAILRYPVDSLPSRRDDSSHALHFTNAPEGIKV